MTRADQLERSKKVYKRVKPVSMVSTVKGEDDLNDSNTSHVIRKRRSK